MHSRGVRHGAAILPFLLRQLCEMDEDQACSLYATLCPKSKNYSMSNRCTP